MAGNMKKASVNSPFKTNAKARCVPQPGQSIPKSFLFMQGIMYSSIESIFALQFYEKKPNVLEQRLELF